MGVEPSHGAVQEQGPQADGHASSAPAASSALPDEKRRLRYALVYLLRLCLWSALIAVHIVLIVRGIMHTLDFCAGTLTADTEQECYADNRAFLALALMVLAFLAAYPICHLFGWRAVRNNRSKGWVLALNIVGIGLSFLGILWGSYSLYSAVYMATTWGLGTLSTLLDLLLAALVAAAAPIEFVLSIIFVRYALRMGAGVSGAAVPNTYQP